jgi:hypothetical protein
VASELPDRPALRFWGVAVNSQGTVSQTYSAGKGQSSQTFDVRTLMTDTPTKPRTTMSMSSPDWGLPRYSKLARVANEKPNGVTPS